MKWNLQWESDQHRIIHLKLAALGVLDILESNFNSSISKVSDHPDLQLTVLHRGFSGMILFSLTHFIQAHGKLCVEPQMHVRLSKTEGIAEALTYRQSIPPIFREVYPTQGGVDMGEKQALNEFLDRWVTDCISTGYQFDIPPPIPAPQGKKRR